MKKIILLFWFISLSCFSQIKGKIVDQKGSPLPFVNIFVENTYNGTTSNENGDFELMVKSTGKFIIVFQNLGYKTKKETITIEKFPFELDVRLIDENFKLNEVTIDRKNNPAIQLIKNAIASRKSNSEKKMHSTLLHYSDHILIQLEIKSRLFN